MHSSNKARNRYLLGGRFNGVAAGALIASLSASALAQAGNLDQGQALLSANSSVASVAATRSVVPVEEINRYYLRLMTQIFDGSKDFSHTQVAGFGRMRKDQQSWTMLDFGDGAVVISARDRLSASAFENISGTDLGVLYDYNTKRIAGTSQLAKFHNEVVRPHLDKAPELGSDADWTASLPSGSLGIPALSGAAVRLDLSRRYFTYDGKPMVLVEYRVPVVSLNTVSGSKVMHWGRGFALSDPGFGTIYANVALHRSATTASDGSIRPYRFFRAAFASDDKGKPMIDIARIPQVAAFYNVFFGKAALDVIPYSDEGLAADQTPVRLASNLDVIAMSIGENGANDNGALAGAQTGGNRGVERPKPLSQIPTFGQSDARRAADAVGARAATDDGLPPSAPRSPGMTTEAHEAAQVMGPRPVEPERPVLTPEEALEEAMQKLEAQKKIPGTRGGGGGGEGGQGGQGGQGSGGGTGTGSLVDQGLDYLETGRNATDKTTAISGGITAVVQDATQLLADSEELKKQINSARQELASAANQYESARKPFSRYTDMLLSMENRGEEITPGLWKVYEESKKRLDSASAVLANKTKEIEATTGDLNIRLTKLNSQANWVRKSIAKLPVDKAAKALELFGESRVGKSVGYASHGMNAYATGTAAINAYDAANNDQSSGELKLTRSYGSDSAGLLALDIAALWGNAASGNALGTLSDGVALLSGSVSDIYVSFKGSEDTSKRVVEGYNESIRLSNAKRDQDIAVVKKDLEESRKEVGLYTQEDPYKDGYDLTSPGYNPDVAKMSETHKQYLIKHNRGEAIRLGLIDPDAPEGGYPSQPQRPATAPKVAAQPKPVDPGPTRAELLRGLAKEIEKQDYPTAPTGANAKRPVKVTKPAEVGPAIDPVQQAELDREARKAQAQADLDAYQAKRLAERKAEEAARALKPRGGPFVVSSFNTKPVTFEPVTFSGVDFDKDGDLFERNADGTTSLKKVGPDDFVSPSFVGPEFNAPKASGLAWTNFDDDDYPGSGEVPAFGFESMSGKIATDLSKWADWLATQDIRQLERLARTAGYPNLASALNDAANLIRLSQDKGYVKWAMTAPSCGGYVGCGPSYSERWGMKISTVKLGNILNQSRDVFSTGGLSDIAISSDRLAYMLRDFGQQDGDIVDVLVQQFGREIFRGRVGLTNGGQAFDIFLRRGLAVLTLTAVNEGAISPNTAGISIQGVTNGNASQSYSLLTGQSATLRIETNKPAGE